MIESALETDFPCGGFKDLHSDLAGVAGVPSIVGYSGHLCTLLHLHAALLCDEGRGGNDGLIQSHYGEIPDSEATAGNNWR